MSVSGSTKNVCLGAFARPRAALFHRRHSSGPIRRRGSPVSNLSQDWLRHFARGNYPASLRHQPLDISKDACNALKAGNRALRFRRRSETEFLVPDLQATVVIDPK